MLFSLHPRLLLVTSALGLVLLAGAARAVTVSQNFDVPNALHCGTPGTGTHYTCAQYGSFPPAGFIGGDAGGTGSALRLTQTTSGGNPVVSNLNTVAFDAPGTPAAAEMIVEFDFVMIPGQGRADGLGFAFLNTATYGQMGAVGPFDPTYPMLAPNLPEEPNFTGSIGIGFDIYKSPGFPQAQEPNDNHVSIHFGQTLAAFPIDPDILDLAGDKIHARIVLRPGNGHSDVSVFLGVGCSQARTHAGFTVVDRFPVPGFTPYPGRLFFGARTGGQTADIGIDDVDVVEDVDFFAPSKVGKWTGPKTWDDLAPAVAIHSSLLPTGQVMFWDRHDFGPFGNGHPRLWDPATQSVMMLPEPPGEGPMGMPYDIFCSGHTLRADGKLFVSGGHIADGDGLSYASTYDPFTNTWERHPDMNAGRWYPTSTTLANGDVLTVGGTFGSYVPNEVPQIFHPRPGTWQTLTGADLNLQFYPFMYQAPDGRVFDAGPKGMTRFLNLPSPGSNAASWSDVGLTNWACDGLVPCMTPRERVYGTSVMYDDGKVLIAGGSDLKNLVPWNLNEAPTASAEIIDLTAPSPAWTYAPPMQFARRQVNSTLLPDGTVLVTGGNRSPAPDDSGGAVRYPELWDPAGGPQGSWKTLAPSWDHRGYHSEALLLPDGRVLSLGGGHPDAIGCSEHKDYEIFSPPYLFKGARPQIASAPEQVHYGQTFFVQTPNAASIAKVTWLRLGSVTHAFNENQRINRLDFAATAGGLSITSPLDANLCPPGHYMLFILNAQGVPSEAKIVQILPSVQLSSAATAIGEGQGPAVLTVTLRGAISEDVTVQYATADGTAVSGSDYSATSGTLTFSATETSKTVGIALTDDSVLESSETFQLSLSNPTGGVILGTTSASMVTITDNEAIVQWSAASFAGTEVSKKAIVTATRAGRITGTATVQYSTSDGSAVAPGDYSPKFGSLSFADGVTSQTFAITVVDDKVAEGVEAATITLFGPSAGTIVGAQAAAAVRIGDNDGSAFFFDPLSYSVSEAGLSATIVVKRSGPHTTAATVTAYTKAQSALAGPGGDFKAVEKVVTFAAGAVSAAVKIPVNNDTVHEGDEIFRVLLKTPTGGPVLGTQRNAKVTIVDND